MRRRSLLWTALLLAAAAAVLVGVLGFFLKQEPDFYAAALPDAADDDEKGAEVLTKLGDLKNDIRSKSEWGAAFTAADLNAFLRANLADGEGLAGLLPGEWNSPRVAADGDKLRVAVRYGRGAAGVVLSAEVRMWLVGREVNTVAVELCGTWAGAVPFGTQTVLDWVSEKARESNVDVIWYRHDGHPVGLFRFYADQTRPTTQIRAVAVADGKVAVAGRSGVGAGPAAGE